MMQKIYKITYWVFLVLSLLIIFEVIRIDSKFREGFGWLFFQLDVGLPLLFLTIFRVCVRKIDSNFKYTLAVGLTLLMMFLCVKYFAVGEVIESSEGLFELILVN